MCLHTLLVRSYSNKCRSLLEQTTDIAFLGHPDVFMRNFVTAALARCAGWIFGPESPRAFILALLLDLIENAVSDTGITSFGNNQPTRGKFFCAYDALGSEGAYTAQS